ncbi:hypothetical protein Tco_1329741 [Tanacetum coccineum]
MGDENPIRTLGDYFKPNHEGYRNTIELLVGNNVRQPFTESASVKLCNLNAEESWALLEDLSLYDNESWNDPRDLAKPVKNHNAHLTCPPRSKLQGQIHDASFPKTSLQQPVVEIKPQQPEEPETRLVEMGIKDLHLNLPVLEDPETPLLVGRGFLATANAVIDCRMAKYDGKESLTEGRLISVKEISRDVELKPFKDTLVFRRVVEFLRAIPINLKCNMWESDDLIKKPINCDKPSKNKDGAWHAKIRLIGPDGEEFTKTLQSIPSTRKLFERESPREIIELDHFYDT